MSGDCGVSLSVGLSQRDAEAMPAPVPDLPRPPAVALLWCSQKAGDAILCPVQPRPQIINRGLHLVAFALPLRFEDFQF